MVIQHGEYAKRTLALNPMRNAKRVPTVVWSRRGVRWAAPFVLSDIPPVNGGNPQRNALENRLQARPRCFDRGVDVVVGVG